MTTISYSRDDVQMHSDGFRPGRPAVNVKVYGGLSDGFDAWAKLAPADHGDVPVEFTEDWVREHVTEEALDGWFWDTCSFEFEMIQQDAEEVLGVTDKQVWQEGRSGGWVVVDGLPDLEDWDAVHLAKWRRFEKWARAIAADVPYLMVSNLYANVYEAAQDEATERARAANQNIATTGRTRL